MAYRHRRGYVQGRYTPKHPEKYKGNVENIIYRSSWELHVNKFLDNNVNVLEWAAEEFAIPYLKPTDRRIHRYYPDYWVKFRNKRGEIVQEVWEVKPMKKVKPTRVGKSKKQQIRESVEFAVNTAKWKAAMSFCQKRGIKFRLMTEGQIFS